VIQCCAIAAREEPARQWAERRERDALVTVVREHLAFFLAIEQVVLALHVDERRPAVLLGDVVHLRGLPRVHRRGAEASHLARAHGVMERLHCLLDRRVGVERVDHMQVEMVGADALE